VRFGEFNQCLKWDVMGSAGTSRVVWKAPLLFAHGYEIKYQIHSIKPATNTPTVSIAAVIFVPLQALMFVRLILANISNKIYWIVSYF